MESVWVMIAEHMLVNHELSADCFISVSKEIECLAMICCGQKLSQEFDFAAA
jgi:hypothetical protein